MLCWKGDLQKHLKFDGYLHVIPTFLQARYSISPRNPLSDQYLPLREGDGDVLLAEGLEDGAVDLVHDLEIFAGGIQ